MSFRTLKFVNYIKHTKNFPTRAFSSRHSLCPDLVRPDDRHLAIIGNKWKLQSSPLFIGDFEPSGGSFQTRSLISRCEDARFAIWGGSLTMNKIHPLLKRKKSLSLNRSDVLLLLVSQKVEILRPFYEELLLHQPIYTMSEFTNCSKKSFSMKNILYKEEGNIELGSVEVLILIADKVSRRVIDLPESYVKDFEGLGLSLQEKGPPRVPLPEVPADAFDHTIKTQYRHTDFYRHVNNKECISWAYDGLYESGVDPGTLKVKQIEVQNLKELDSHQIVTQKVWINKKENLINAIITYENKPVTYTKLMYY
ncbi:DgyrCDS10944 [Dimorphilus gyrociliatus]|uniref:DgyrCDS10944 n=1 Tax=Dimorphilus gyrociliatus TaxID=2664684 RepID=A0A7I8W1V6_9ANNE|nr:DgyrCDS10944 [Dimorphilus gyrociliatus]